MGGIKCGLLMVPVGPALAEPAYMETRRCVRACMRNRPQWDGANFKADERCTKTNCNGKEKRKRR